MAMFNSYVKLPEGKLDAKHYVISMYLIYWCMFDISSGWIIHDL